MADINLLQNQLKDTTLVSTRRTQVVMVATSILLIMIVGSMAGLYFLTNQIRTLTIKKVEENKKVLVQVTNEQEGVASAQAYQAKLSNLDLLLENHIFITPLLEELGGFTYQRAQFLNFSLEQETGSIHVEGMVESYEALGKLLLGLSTSENFSDVKLLSVQPSAGEIAGYTFSVDLTANENLFFKTQ